MGIGCVWSTRCRGRSRNAAARVENDHEAGGNDLSRQDYPQLPGDSPLVEVLKKTPAGFNAKNTVLLSRAHQSRLVGHRDTGPTSRLPVNQTLLVSAKTLARNWLSSHALLGRADPSR
jgi:hypothetical protein